MENKGKRLKGLNERSEEVEVVMGQTPSWVFRWGITIIAAIVGCLFASTWFVRWPDTMTAPGDIEIASSTGQWNIAVIQLSAEQVKLLQDGMKAKVLLNAKDENWGAYQGTIEHIPLMTDSTRTYSVHIRINKYVKTTEGNESIAELEREFCNISHPILETTVIITLSDKRLMHRIIGK